jgi:hypothetical protein
MHRTRYRVIKAGEPEHARARYEAKNYVQISDYALLVRASN